MTDPKNNKILGSFILLTGSDQHGTPRILRAINPLESTLKKYTTKSIMEAVITAASKLIQNQTRKNEQSPRLDIIIDGSDNRATTNRPSVNAWTK